MDDDPEDERAADDDGEPTENRKTATTPTMIADVEENPRVARIAQQLEQDPDQHRAEHDPGLASRSRRG